MTNLKDAEASRLHGHTPPSAKLDTRSRYRGRRARWTLKSLGNRALDVALAMAALTLTLPLILCISLLIVLDDPGPVLVLQRRVQADGRQFALWRFRTYSMDANGRLEEYLSSHRDEHLRYQLGQALRHDPRLSKAGAVLHRTGLEDMPMLINIAAGQLPVFGRYTWRQFLAWLDANDDAAS